MNNYLKSTVLVLVVIISVVLLAGCVSTPKSKVGKETVIETSGKKPEWIMKSPKDKDVLYFVGEWTGARKKEYGIKDARMQAISMAAEMVQAKVLSLYEAARVETGVDDSQYGTAIKDGLIVKAKATLSGIEQKEIYWEKIEKREPAGVSYVYNVAVLVAVPREELRRALQEELKKQVEKLTPGDREAQEFLKNLEEKFEKESFE
jgi:hypothetical protein